MPTIASQQDLSVAEPLLQQSSRAATDAQAGPRGMTACITMSCELLGLLCWCKQ